MACHGLLTALILLLWLAKLWFILSPMTSYILWTMVIPGGSDGKESICNAGRRGFNPWVGKIRWRREWQFTPVFLPGESMDGGAWGAAVHGVVKSQLGAHLCTPCQNFPSGERICLPMHLPQETRVWSLGGEDPLEEEMATHSSILAWRIPCSEGILGLQSMGLQRVGHDSTRKRAEGDDAGHSVLTIARWRQESFPPTDENWEGLGRIVTSAWGWGSCGVRGWTLCALGVASRKKRQDRRTVFPHGLITAGRRAALTAKTRDGAT